MDTFKKTQDRLRQNLWDIRTNDGSVLTAVHSTTGEAYVGTTAGFNAIFNAKPTVDPDINIIRARINTAGALTLDGPAGELSIGGSHKGDWDAYANVPKLSSGIGAKGDKYRISKTGYTNLDSVGYWQQDEFVVFDGICWGRLTGFTSSFGASANIAEQHVYGSAINEKAQELITMQSLSKNGVSNVSLKACPASVNTSGLEWKSGFFRNIACDIMQGDNLRRPTKPMLQYLKNIGVSHIRLPFAWEAIQPVLFNSPITNAFVSPYYTTPGMLHTKFLALLKQVVTDCADLGISVVLDCHSFGRYYDNYADPVTNRLPIRRMSTKANYAFCTVNAKEVAKAVTGFTTTAVTVVGSLYETGDTIKFTNGNIPPEITLNTHYHIVSAVGNDFALSTTFGGTALSFTPTAAFGVMSKTDLSASFNANIIKATGEVTDMPAGWAANTAVTFTAGPLPLPFVIGTTYYVKAGKFLALTAGGATLIPTAGEWKQTLATRAVIGTVSNNNEGYYVERTFKNGLLTSAHLSDLWTRLHTEFQGFTNVVGYGLANEVGISQAGPEWDSIANATISALRAAGCTQLLLVDGPYIDSSKAPYALASFRKIYDPLNNFAHEIHWYFDANRSGSKFDYEAESLTQSSVEGNPLIRSLSYCSDGYAGVDLATGARMGASLEIANKYAIKPVYVGETAFPASSDEWSQLSKPFVYAARRNKSIISLWGTASFGAFVYYMNIFPRVHGAKVLPDRQVAVLTWDAQEDFNELCVFVENGSFVIELVGSSTQVTKISITTSLPVGLPSEIYLAPGLNTLSKLKIPTNAAEVSYTFVSGKGTTVTKLIAPSAYAADGTAASGKYKLLASNASFWKATDGIGDFAGSPITTKVAVVPDSLNSDTRFFLKNLRSYFDGNVAIATSLAGKKGWKYSVGDGEIGKADFLYLGFAGTKGTLVKVSARDNGNDFTEAKGFVYYNGVNNDGYGATLSNLTHPELWGSLTLDSVVLATGDIVAVGNVYTAAGLYIVDQAGSLTTPALLSRLKGYETPQHYRNIAVKIISGLNNKGITCYYSNGDTATGTWGTTGLTLGTSSPAYGLNTATQSRYTNYGSNFFLGFSLTRSGAWTASRIGGISHSTAGSNAGGYAVHTNSSNQLEDYKFCGDTPSVYGYYGRYYVSAAIPVDTETTVIIAIANRQTKVYLNGALVHTSEEAYIKNYNCYTYDNFSVGGIKNAYNYIDMTDNCIIHNAFLSEEGNTLTATDAAGIHNFITS